MDSTTHALPATPKQIAYARSLALRNQTLLPGRVQQDRRSLRRDRGAGPAEAGIRHGPAAHVEAGGLRGETRPDQTARRPGGMLPRQRADVEVDRREQVIPTPAGSALRSVCHTVAWQPKLNCQPIGWQVRPSGLQPRSNSCPSRARSASAASFFCMSSSSAISLRTVLTDRNILSGFEGNGSNP